MPSTIAEKIIAEYAIAFPAKSADCNLFVKALATVFFEPDLFTGPNMDADAIIAELSTSSDWKQLGKSHSNAIKEAKANEFVIAGLTSTELTSEHGYLAIIIGLDGQNSGEVIVPICYAGSLSSTARVAKKRVSETFPAKLARESRISYFSRSPEVSPIEDAVTRLTNYIAGERATPQVVLSPSTKKGKIKTKRGASR